jgi:hypothetical protein
MLNIAPPQAEADPASQHPLGKSEARKNGHLDVPPHISVQGIAVA